MEIYGDFIHKVEFDKILHLLENYCLGEPGRERCIAMLPGTDYEEIQTNLNQVAEFKEAIIQNNALPLVGYDPLNEEISRVHIEGFVLSLDSFLIIRRLLQNIQAVHKYFTPPRRVEFKELYVIISSLDERPDLIKSIDRVIGADGEVRSDASDDLVRIRKQIQSKGGEIEKVFRQLTAHYRQKGWLSESGESIRNGRRVFTVPAEFKRQISGIIHDESATGKTVYIEPDELIVINNALFSLYIEEKKEIYKILQLLSAVFRPNLDYLYDCETIISTLDLIQAKARLAFQYEGVKPVLHNRPAFKVFGARHPLLYLKNKQSDRSTIPFDLDLHAPNRLVLLSGPNAGGKSITMKATGLLQIMVQCGMLVPMQGFSEMGIFKKFFADIGDQQSIEEDLSTYSSHLQNMKQILEVADDNTLILMDEFGSGTDPKMGGAIAEAILKDLNHKKSWGIITTHYSNLKLFAFHQKGLVNAAMTFDQENLKPTFQFRIGKPGSSYAFEIANKSGLPDNVISYARRKAGEKENEVDDLLIDLQREKSEVEEKLADLSAKEKMLNRLIANYEQVQKDHEVRRKKLKMEIKEVELQRMERENHELNKIINELKNSKDVTKAKEVLQSRKRQRDVISKDYKEISEIVAKAEVIQNTKPLEKGSPVKMRNGSSTGVIESIDKKNATILMGDLRMQVPLKDLISINTPLEINRSKNVSIDTVESNSKFETKIDIRGFRKDEALKRVESFLDQAALSSASRLEILHGKGDGVLKKAVRQKLLEFDFVKTVRHPQPEDGGDGITIADLKM